MTGDIFLNETIRDEAVMKVKTDFGKTAADIGSGTGFMTEGLLNAGLNVIVVEYSEDKVKYLKERFGHLKEVGIIRSSPQKINAADDSVDYVFSNMHLHNTEDPAQLIEEMMRILKPGGKIAITDITEHKFEEFQKENNHLWPGFNMPDLYEWFVKAGLKEISIEVLSQAIQFQSASGEELKFSVFLAYGEKH